MQVHGIIPPVVTPMLANEDIDLAGLRKLIDHQIACGVHGIFVMGTTGECYSLSDEEKQQIVATAVAHVNKRVPVYAGTGAETTREAIRHTQMAEREGVDGVSVITPYFVMPNQGEIADHYRRIAAATSASRKVGISTTRTPSDRSLSTVPAGVPDGHESTRSGRSAFSYIWARFS